jgi:hypothetical protein
MNSRPANDKLRVIEQLKAVVQIYLNGHAKDFYMQYSAALRLLNKHYKKYYMIIRCLDVVSAKYAFNLTF